MKVELCVVFKQSQELCKARRRRSGLAVRRGACILPQVVAQNIKRGARKDALLGGCADSIRTTQNLIREI